MVALASALTVGVVGNSLSFCRGTAERPFPLPYSTRMRPCASSVTFTSSRGILRTESAKWRACTAARPDALTVHGTVTDVVMSRSVFVMRNSSFSASMSTVERIGMALLPGTDARAVESAYERSVCWIVNSIRRLLIPGLPGGLAGHRWGPVRGVETGWKPGRSSLGPERGFQQPEISAY